MLGKWNDRLREAAVGGATGLCVVALFIIWRAVVEGASAGDWLGFAGVIVGVMLTAGVTVGVQHYADRQKLHPYRLRLLFYIDILERSVSSIGSDLEGDPVSDSTGVASIVEEIRNMDFELARDIHLQIVALNEALGALYQRTASGKIRMMPTSEHDPNLLKAKAAVQALKRRVT